MYKIGIDFDNTIVCYDEAFYLAAIENNLIPKNLTKSKNSIKDYLIIKKKEAEWTKLQGYVYGSKMDLAKSFLGFEDFIKYALKNNFEINIISHKTRFPYLGDKYDLHLSAKNWLNSQKFYNEKIKVFFELTLEKKINRIKKENCNYFIDDLIDVLNHQLFPKNVKKIYFNSVKFPSNSAALKNIYNWIDIISYFKNETFNQ
jgi:hypothetical protein